MPNPAIISLAVLKVNWDVLRKDYLENFVPLVAECIRHSSEDVISLPDLQGQLRQRFGLLFPQNAVRTILGRVRKRGFVQLRDGAFRPNREKLKELEFEKVQQQVLAMHESLVKSLIAYSSATFRIDLTVDDAESALQSYLEENQLAIIGSTATGTVLPLPRQAGPKIRFVVASFVRHLQESNSSDMAYLETVVKGTMLANAIFLPDPTQAERKFRKTEIYFDTSFLVYGLGYTGEARRAPCVELLKLLYETGADLRCFRHSRDEVHGILEACADRIVRGHLQDAYGPTIEYFIERGCKASDVELFAARLERDLALLRIRVVEKPPYVKEYQIDEREFQALLSEHIQYRNPRARERDVDSVSAIMRLRRLQEFFIIEESRAVFVTTNAELAKTAREFFYRDATPGAVSPVVSDHSLTTLLWLKGPLKAPDLPRKRIMADCYAATQPDESLWSLYLAEVERLEKDGRFTADDYYLLRHSLEAKSALMELTLGDEQAFAQGTVPEILELIRSRIQGEIKGELQESKQLLKQALSDLREKEVRVDAQRARILERASTSGQMITKLLEYVILGALVVGAASTFPWNLPQPASAWGRYSLSCLQAALLIVTVENLMRGVTIKAWLRSFELRITKWLERRLLGLLEAA